MKVIIAGGRDFNDYISLYNYCDEILINQQHDNIEIVSGHANGADKLGEKYASEKNYNIKLFEANWSVFGKSAGYKRNEEMAKYADALIVFWDRESKGTKHMIEIAKKYKLKTRIYYYKNEQIKKKSNN